MPSFIGLKGPVKIRALVERIPFDVVLRALGRSKNKQVLSLTCLYVITGP